MICDRAVLDANCIRGPPQAELQALVTSGYRLSISIDGLREVWAKSIRSNQRDMLTARLGLPLPLMDEMAPVAFTGSALLGMVGTVPGEVAADGARFREQVMKGILALRRDGLTHDDWIAVGRALQAELAAEERRWDRQIDAAIDLEKTVLDVEGLVCPRKRAFRILKRRLCPPFNARVPPSVEARFDAFRSYLAMKLVNGRNQRPQANDYLDGRHLYHLGWPAFVATTDFKFMEAVDASGTRQHAWVRSPVELVCDRPSRAEPWGEAAEAISKTFRRPPRDSLKKRQDDWRGRLRSSG